MSYIDPGERGEGGEGGGGEGTGEIQGVGEEEEEGKKEGNP